MRQMNLTMNTKPPLITPSTDFIIPITTFPFAKRKFSSSTLASNRLQLNTSPIQPNVSTTSVTNYTRNLRNVTQGNHEINKPKMLWGKPTWFLFHMIAEKMKPIYFLQNRMEVLQLINTICVNLPCPTCAEHAKAYIEKNRFFQIRNLDELKMMLFHFHNSVNARKNERIFQLDELSQYSQAIPENIVENFFKAYGRKSKNIRLLADDMHRQNIILQLREWFQTHKDVFDGPASMTP
jgi:Erv1 / Alr family